MTSASVEAMRRRIGEEYSCQCSTLEYYYGMNDAYKQSIQTLVIDEAAMLSIWDILPAINKDT